MVAGFFLYEGHKVDYFVSKTRQDIFSFEKLDEVKSIEFFSSGVETTEHNGHWKINKSSFPEDGIWADVIIMN